MYSVSLTPGKIEAGPSRSDENMAFQSKIINLYPCNFLYVEAGYQSSYCPNSGLDFTFFSDKRLVVDIFNTVRVVRHALNKACLSQTRRIYMFSISCEGNGSKESPMVVSNS